MATKNLVLFVLFGLVAGLAACDSNDSNNDGFAGDYIPVEAAGEVISLPLDLGWRDGGLSRTRQEYTSVVLRLDGEGGWRIIYEYTFQSQHVINGEPTGDITSSELTFFEAGTYMVEGEVITLLQRNRNGEIQTDSQIEAVGTFRGDIREETITLDVFFIRGDFYSGAGIGEHVVFERM